MSDSICSSSFVAVDDMNVFILSCKLSICSLSAS